MARSMVGSGSRLFWVVCQGIQGRHPVNSWHQCFSAFLPFYPTSRVLGFRPHLVKFSKDCTELDMKNCQLEGQVSTALVTTGCGICIHHGHLVQEVLHGWSMIFQEAVHKGHVGFLLTKPALEPNWLSHDRQLPTPYSLVPSSPPHSPSTYGARLARFWMTLAMSVRVRAGPGAGCSGARPKRLGANIAGHRSLRKREAHTSRGPSASEPRAWHASRQLENTVPSSAGNQLGQKKQWLEERDREA